MSFGSSSESGQGAGGDEEGRQAEESLTEKADRVANLQAALVQTAEEIISVLGEEDQAATAAAGRVRGAAHHPAFQPALHHPAAHHPAVAPAAHHPAAHHPAISPAAHHPAAHHPAAHHPAISPAAHHPAAHHPAAHHPAIAHHPAFTPVAHHPAFATHHPAFGGL